MPGGPHAVASQQDRDAARTTGEQPVSLQRPLAREWQTKCTNGRLIGIVEQGVAHPKLPHPAQQSSGRTKNFAYGMVYVGYSF